MMATSQDGMTVPQRINSALRVLPSWVLYPIGLLPVIWLFWQGAVGHLGADPVKAVERELGLLGLQLIVAGLCVSPLRWVTGINLIRFRRAIGLIAFFYVALHLTVWVVLDLQFRWGEIWSSISKRPYIIAGFVGFLALVPLAITSNNLSIRKLGPKTWQALHKLTYLAAVAGAVHFLWLVKAWPVEPLLYLAGVLVLLGWRGVRALRERV
jgi:methionine sulfoxide reductase heme-binding subunit